uniref:Uncharacterized protein n=1 Tax=Rhizophora mucronata TaxID=61149 RepID=A0A2P2P9M4_RHIMU
MLFGILRGETLEWAGLLCE